MRNRKKGTRAERVLDPSTTRSLERQKIGPVRGRGKRDLFAAGRRCRQVKASALCAREECPSAWIRSEGGPGRVSVMASRSPARISRRRGVRGVQTGEWTLGREAHCARERSREGLGWDRVR